MMETSVPHRRGLMGLARSTLPSGGMALQALAQGAFFVWMPVFLGAGIGCYFSLLSEPDPRLYPGLLVTGFLLPFAVRHSARMLPVAWALCFLMLGFAIAGWHANKIAAPVLDYRYYGPIEGRIVGIDRSGSGKVRLTLDQVRLDRMAPRKRPLRVRVSLHGEQLYLDPKPGQMVMMTGHLSPPSGPVEPRWF